MSKKAAKRCLKNGAEVRSSSHLSLLFFALVLSSSLATPTQAQSTKKGWSVGSSPDTSLTQPVTEAETDIEGSLPEQAEGSLLEEAESSLPEQAEGSLLEQAEGSLLEEAEGSLPEQAEGSLSEQAEGSLSEQAEGSLSEQAEGSLSEQAEGSLSEQAEGSLPEQAEGSLPEQAADASIPASVENESDVQTSSAINDAEPEIAAEAAPTSPVLDLDPQLRDNLERQFKQIVEIQENENAFSENLGEAYLSHGQALQKAGRLDEARKMYANALHISKINNGVNSIEQRPVLRAMFEMNFIQGNAEEAEESLKRIIWLEKKQPAGRDDYSFDMVVRLGNLYIDRYLYRPNVSQAALAQLNLAERYLKYAIDRYGAYNMDDLFMPYGELALVHFFKSKIQVDVERPAFEIQRQRSFPQFEQNKQKVKLPVNSHGRAERYLNQYLIKAQAEQRTEHVVQALTNLGDINLLFDLKQTASQYYMLAWTEAQKLEPDHPLVLSFDQPQVLPAFNYSQERGFVEGFRETLFIPTTFSLTELGRVKKFAAVEGSAVADNMVKRARRVAKRLRFRPVIENGKMIAVNEFTHEVMVKVSRQQAKN